MRIDCIYVCGWRGDLRFTQCCVASIRQWYPHIRICLIQDELNGCYDTSVLEKAYGVEIFPSLPRRYGWGVGKLEPLFEGQRERFLVIDSDVVFVGPVLDHLEHYDEDFVVVDEHHEPEEMEENYFQPCEVERLFPGFRFPGYVFNTGQFVGTSGILKRADFSRLIAFDQPPRYLMPEVFRCGEQGLLNFVLQAQHQAGALTLRRVQFMRWPPLLREGDVDLARLGSDSPYDFLLHWAGPKDIAFDAVPMAAVLLHFDRIYRRRTVWLRLLRWM